MAYDAYNGTLLWERRIPGAVRVRADVDGGNLAATPDGIYVAAHGECHRLDPATGRTIRVFEMPVAPDGPERRWGYVACDGEAGARAKGVMQVEGKEYEMQDGDVAHFRVGA